MSSLKTFGLVLLAAILFGVWSSVFTVDVRQKALVLRFVQVAGKLRSRQLNFTWETNYLEDYLLTALLMRLMK